MIVIGFLVSVLGSSVCNQGSPLGFSDKNDEMVHEQASNTAGQQYLDANIIKATNT